MGGASGAKALDRNELGSLEEWKNYQPDLSPVSNEEKMKWGWAVLQAKQLDYVPVAARSHLRLLSHSYVIEHLTVRKKKKFCIKLCLCRIIPYTATGTLHISSSLICLCYFVSISQSLPSVKSLGYLQGFLWLTVMKRLMDMITLQVELLRPWEVEF